jgi:Tfp pilus assembly PilM family ATPase
MAKRTAVIEKSDSFLKVLLIHGSGSKMTVTRAFSAEIDSRSTVGEVLAAAELSYDDMILVIPRNNVIIKQLDLPTTDLKEIHGIIDIMVNRLTPFPKEEIVYGFEVIPAKGGGSSRVLVGIMQNIVINTLVSQFRGESVPIQRIMLGSECFAALSPFIEKKLGAEMYAVLDFNSDSSDFCVISGAQLLFTKLVHFGAYDMEHSGWENRFAEELDAVFTECKVQDVKPKIGRAHV